MSKRRGVVEDECKDLIMPEKINKQLDITMNMQENTQWCYAAIIEAVAKYYGVHKHNNLGITLNQTNISNWYIENVKDYACKMNNTGVNCPQDPTELLNKLKQVNNFRIYNDYYNLNSHSKYIEYIITGIDNNYPTIARIGANGGYHYVLFIGYKSSLTDTTKLKSDNRMISFQYLDPLHPTEIRSITDTCLFRDGINADFINSSTNKPFVGKSPLDGIMILHPKAETAGGGKRNTRRRSKKRAMKKTLRRR